ncbi:MAG: addiction module protein [Crocosphaera sp.]|nr:addiction module protein [Crocosphaera sp.]
MRSIEQLTQEILELPSLSRQLLAKKLIESLELESDPNIAKAWTTEAKKRRDEIHNGMVQPISGQEALEQVRQMLKP